MPKGAASHAHVGNGGTLSRAQKGNLTDEAYWALPPRLAFARSRSRLA